MRKLWKALALVLALAMLFAAVSGCAAKTDAETESQQTETAAPAAQEETDASGVPGVEDKGAGREADRTGEASAVSAL